LYHERVGVEALALQYGLFQTESSNIRVRYQPLDNLKEIDEFAFRYLGDQAKQINKLAALFWPLTTDQTEIIATLFACWNDFLVKKHSPTDEEIMTECVQHWHPKKARFSRARLSLALSWMRQYNVVPAGCGKVTKVRNYGQAPSV